ncbi:hypothetical protein SLEP1_g40151 [Rubroshorea leprosula]|uniref:Uncharacterized protein n=1 Tax=Rubroshorea leprosula TaxID=152421 RepID=A0AAV5L3E5_9ROSI|nr:hypothetical protein SLEP1_g40151 [Rubroshorea leprosula]
MEGEEELNDGVNEHEWRNRKGSREEEEDEDEDGLGI